MKRILSCVALFASFSFSGCFSPPLAPKIREDFQAHLKIGASRTTIEEFLGSRGYRFEYYDRFKMYQSFAGGKEAGENKHGVEVDIYVDHNERLSKIDVNDWYTFL